MDDGDGGNGDGNNGGLGKTDKRAECGLTVFFFYWKKNVFFYHPDKMSCFLFFLTRNQVDHGNWGAGGGGDCRHCHYHHVCLQMHSQVSLECPSLV